MRTKKKRRRACPKRTPQDEQDIQFRELLEKINRPLPTDDPVLEKLREILRVLEERRKRPRRVIVSLECMHSFDMPPLIETLLDDPISDPASSGSLEEVFSMV
jgi:hypothetical protein